MLTPNYNKWHPAALNIKIHYNASWLCFPRSLRLSWRALRPSGCCVTVKSNSAWMMGRTWIASWPRDRFRYACSLCPLITCRDAFIWYLNILRRFEMVNFTYNFSSGSAQWSQSPGLISPTNTRHLKAYCFEHCSYIVSRCWGFRNFSGFLSQYFFCNSSTFEYVCN